MIDCAALSWRVEVLSDQSIALFCPHGCTPLYYDSPVDMADLADAVYEHLCEAP